MDLEHDGYTILPGVISQSDCEIVAQEIVTAIGSQQAGKIGSIEGRIVGGRNLQDCWDGWRRVLSQPSIFRSIAEHVSSTAGLVRILYFDKPPGHSWSLSLHRDRTIAVAQHHLPPFPFSRPTVKAGVPHVIATESLLQSMLTYRLHLDPMTHQNGPVTVVPGSHKTFEAEGRGISRVIQCSAGDIFVMRPLLLHGSQASEPETEMHRRVLHLEIAKSEQLPSPYGWHRFEPIF